MHVESVGQTVCLEPRHWNTASSYSVKIQRRDTASRYSVEIQRRDTASRCWLSGVVEWKPLNWSFQWHTFGNSSADPLRRMPCINNVRPDFIWIHRFSKLIKTYQILIGNQINFAIVHCTECTRKNIFYQKRSVKLDETCNGLFWPFHLARLRPEVWVVCFRQPIAGGLLASGLTGVKR